MAASPKKFFPRKKYLLKIARQNAIFIRKPPYKVILS
jgi:hypothetical protein